MICVCVCVCRDVCLTHMYYLNLSLCTFNTEDLNIKGSLRFTMEISLCIEKGAPYTHFATIFRKNHTSSINPILDNLIGNNFDFSKYLNNLKKYIRPSVKKEGSYSS